VGVEHDRVVFSHISKTCQKGKYARQVSYKKKEGKIKIKAITLLLILSLFILSFSLFLAVSQSSSEVNFKGRRRCAY